MLIGSLFSGIGGLELGLEEALNGKTIWQVEQDAAARAVLARRWPNADRSVCDVTKAGRGMRYVDVICGGFPCQDISPAGKKRGLAGARSGLVFEMLRVIDELSPRAVVLENSHHGWRKWVPVVRRALHELGYASVPLRVSAEDVGAPHRRARCFCVGVANSDRVELRKQPGRSEAGPPAILHGGDGEDGIAADADGIDGRPRGAGGAGFAGTIRSSGAQEVWTPPHADGERPIRQNDGAQFARVAGHDWRSPPPAIRRVDDGIPRRLDKARLRQCGNAVVPQVAFVVGTFLREVLR